MGEIVAVSNGEVDGVTKQQNTDGAGAGAGASNKSSNSTDTRTRTAGNISGAGNNSGAGAGATEKEELLELAILTDEEKEKFINADEKEKKRILKNARRREQYAEQKKANGGTVKPRKVRKKKTDEQPNPIDKNSLNMLISSASVIIASRPNCEHWLLNEKEINSISEPLSKMIAESTALQNIGQYSNQIALVMACVTIIVPRLVITVSKVKENKKVERTKQHTNTTAEPIGNTGKTKISNIKDNRRNDRQPTDDSTNDFKNELFSVPTIY